MKLLKAICIVVMVMKHRCFLLKKNMINSWMQMKYSCKRMMKGCQWKRNITKHDCRMPSCNSRNNITSETKRCLQILQREILPRNLKIIHLLRIILKRTQLQRMLWRKERRRKNLQRKCLKQERRQSSKSYKKPLLPLTLKVRWPKLKYMFHSMS